MTIQHVTDIEYDSSVTDDLTLSYDFSYDDTLPNRPLCICMHPFTGTASEIDLEIKNRLISNYNVCLLIPEMRGRGDAEGDEDCNGLELYDVYDALVDALSSYSVWINSTKIHMPMCISGGAGNGYKLVCAFPDLFGVVGLFYGISDYGYDSLSGWWWTHAVRRTTLETWIGDTPSNVPDKYYVRGGLFFVDNTKYSNCNVYHDSEDSSVPVTHAINVKSSILELAYTNWEFNLSNASDDPRWIHGYPKIGHQGEPNIQAEPELFSKINSGNYDNPSIDSSGTFKIPSYLRTKQFSVFLGDGLSDAGTIQYNLNTGVFIISNNLITLNDNMDVKFQRFNLLSNTLYDVYIDNVKSLIRADAEGTLLYETTLDASESINIEIRGVSEVIQKVFGEGGGIQIGGDHKTTHIFSGSPTKAFSSDVQMNLTNTRIILLKWTIGDEIKNTASVVNAFITIYFSKNAVASTVKVHKVLTNYGVTDTDAGATEVPASQGQPTWDNAYDYNGGGDVGWYGGVGVGWSGNDRDVQEDQYVLDGTEVNGSYITLDVTSMCQDWIRTPSSNFGVCLICSTVADNRFHSQTAANAELRPTLTINYNDTSFSLGKDIYSKPAETPLIELPIGHSFTDRLQARFLFNEREKNIFDWTQNKNEITVIGSPTQHPDGVECSSTGIYLQLNNEKQVVNSDNCTIVIRFQSLEDFEDGVNHFFIHGSGGGAQLYLAKTSNLLEFNIHDGSTLRWIRLQESHLPNWNTDTQIAIQWGNDPIYDDKYLVFNIDGEYVTPYTSKDTDSPVGSFSVVDTLTLMNHTNGNYPVNGIFKDLQIFDKVVPEETIRNIYNNLYSIF